MQQRTEKKTHFFFRARARSLSTIIELFLEKKHSGRVAQNEYLRAIGGGGWGVGGTGDASEGRGGQKSAPFAFFSLSAFSRMSPPPPPTFFRNDTHKTHRITLFFLSRNTTTTTIITTASELSDPDIKTTLSFSPPSFMPSKLSFPLFLSPFFFLRKRKRKDLKKNAPPPFLITLRLSPPLSLPIRKRGGEARPRRRRP